MRKIIKNMNDKGIPLPVFHDPASKKPSITIMFSYVTFIVSVVSVILLHIYPNLLIPTIASLSFWTISTMFYLLRKLTKAKLDLSQKSIELSNSSDNSSENEIGD